jgi:hypothetical protein
MLKYQQERFADIRPEIEELAKLHGAEVKHAEMPAPFDPDWDKMEQLEQAGVFFVTTARTEAGELVGYVASFVVRSLHYKSISIAMDDAHFLKKEYRKGFAALRLIRESEKIPRSMGVTQNSFHTKAHSGLDRSKVFERLGYRLAEYIYVKIF